MIERFDLLPAFGIRGSRPGGERQFYRDLSGLGTQESKAPRSGFRSHDWKTNKGEQARRSRYVGFLLSLGLSRRRHQNACCRDGEGAAEAVALEGFAIRTVIGVIPVTGIVIPGLVDLCGLTDSYASSRDAAVERFEGQTDISEQEGLFAGALPRPMSRGRYRARGKGQLIGFRVAASGGVGLDSLEGGKAGYGRGVEPRTEDTMHLTGPAVRQHVEQPRLREFRVRREQPKQS